MTFLEDVHPTQFPRKHAGASEEQPEPVSQDSPEASSQRHRQKNIFFSFRAWENETFVDVLPEEQGPSRP